MRIQWSAKVWWLPGASKRGMWHETQFSVATRQSRFLIEEFPALWQAAHLESYDFRSVFNGWCGL